jgi:hypothetical protein
LAGSRSSTPNRVFGVRVLATVFVPINRASRVFRDMAASVWRSRVVCRTPIERIFRPAVLVVNNEPAVSL